MDINPKSYHLIAFELLNPLFYILNFPSNFFEKSEVYVAVVWTIDTFMNSNREHTIPYFYDSLTVLLSACEQSPRFYVLYI